MLNEGERKSHVHWEHSVLMCALFGLRHFKHAKRRFLGFMQIYELANVDKIRADYATFTLRQVGVYVELVKGKPLTLRKPSWSSCTELPAMRFIMHPHM